MTKKASKKKRQHYVPRLILRGFSPNGKSISLMTISSRKLIRNASLAAQCYEDYFYGKDGVVEDGFSSLESSFRASLADYSVDHLEGLNERALQDLKIFGFLQHHRTVSSASLMNKMTGDLMAHIMPQMDLPKPPPGISVNDLRFKLIAPQDFVISQALQLIPLAFDLEVKFLRVERGPGFIVSDHPAVACNQWAENHSLFQTYEGTQGVGLQGFQLFLPLTPQVCLVMYDSRVYTFGSPRRRVVSIGSRDARLINDLQAMSGDKCIYFDPRSTNEDEVTRALASREKLRPVNPFTMTTGLKMPPPRKGASSSKLIVTTRAAMRTGRRLNCAQVLGLNLYQGYRGATLPIRNPTLAEFLESLRKEGVMWWEEPEALKF